MKKILPILLLSALFVSVFAFSASASVDVGDRFIPNFNSISSNHEGYDYILVWDGKDTGLTYIAFSQTPFFYSNGQLYNDDGLIWRYSDAGGYWDSPQLVNIFLTANAMTPNKYTLVWTSYDILRSDGSVYLSHIEPIYPICDGSTCPANDVNSDGVCDDCGMTLSLRSFGNVYEIVVKHSEDLTLLYRITEVETGTVFNAIYDDDRITISFDNQVRYQQFELVDGEWQEYNTVSIEWDNIVISHPVASSIIRSDFDVFYPNGDPFFLIPLWEKVEGVTQGMLNTEVEAVHSTMMILTLCGVGLVALLIGLSLLVKVLPRFLKR